MVVRNEQKNDQAYDQHGKAMSNDHFSKGTVPSRTHAGTRCPTDNKLGNLQLVVGKEGLK